MPPSPATGGPNLGKVEMARAREAQVLGVHKPLIGVVHLQPLPGSPGYQGSMKRVIRRALEDASTYLEGGMHGLLVENYGDRPFHPDRVPPETIAAMGAVAREIRRIKDAPLGINVLRNDGEAAVAVGAAVEARFVRVNVLAGTMLTDQGIVEGRAAEVLRLRSRLGAKLEIWADLLVKHAAPLTETDPAAAAADLVERAMADALIVTGPRTGEEADAGLLERLRRRMPGVPWIVGSGIRARELSRYWEAADAFIVATSLERGGRPGAVVDRVRVRELVAEHRRLASSGRADAPQAGTRRRQR